MDSALLLALAQTAQLAVPVNTAPASTAASGTPTPAGGAETIDAILGVYQCPLVAGRRYRAVLDGLVGNGSVVGDTFLINIRNSGSSSTPTTASTLVAQQEWACQTVGTSGRGPLPVSNSFIAPATGLNTLAVFAARNLGAGVFTPLSPPNGVRELYVTYLGTV